MSTPEPAGSTPDLGKQATPTAPSEQAPGPQQAPGVAATPDAAATRIPDPAEVFPELSRPTAFAGYVPPQTSAGYAPRSFGPTPGAAGLPDGYGPPAQAPKRLTRSAGNRWIGGVCGGIAEYFDWDPNLVRLVFVLSILLPGPQFLVYAVLWLVIPRASS